MGGGKNLLSFIETELILDVDKNYTAAPYRKLLGHSFGGIYTLNAYMTKIVFSILNFL
jgi:predicted alpha/beta superfamily hydrolase